MSSNVEITAPGPNRVHGGGTQSAGDGMAGNARSVTWGDCPNCHALVLAQALDCLYCGAVFGLGAAWRVRELPGRVPSATESAALAVAARQRAEQAAENEANRRRQYKRVPVGNLSEQLLNTTDRLALQHTNTAAKPDADLLRALAVSLALAVAAAVLGGGFAEAIGVCVAILLHVAVADREAGFQRTVLMDVTNATLLVDLAFPQREPKHRRCLPASTLRLRLDRCDTQVEGVAETCWRVLLVLPHDAGDPGDASIELAVFGGPDVEAARALCRIFIPHLGLPDLPLQWHRLNSIKQQSGSRDEAA